MSGYTELRDLGVTFRPPSRPLPPSAGQRAQFDAPWRHTVELLARELRHLDARRIVVELALQEGDLRQDGLPRAGARMTSDSVRIAFDSSYGPLMYETGRFSSNYSYSRHGQQQGWQMNLRAIALGLEALRKVERYGITKRGEQYAGWKALPASTDPAAAIQTSEQARAVLWAAAGFDYGDGRDLPAATLDEVGRAAVKATHPDRPGGDETEFRKVQRAREVLGVA